MIPPSYLFRDLYRQAWLDPVPDQAPPPPEHPSGGRAVGGPLRLLAAPLRPTRA